MVCYVYVAHAVLSFCLLTSLLFFRPINSHESVQLYQTGLSHDIPDVLLSLFLWQHSMSVHAHVHAPTLHLLLLLLAIALRTGSAQAMCVCICPAVTGVDSSTSELTLMYTCGGHSGT